MMQMAECGVYNRGELVVTPSMHRVTEKLMSGLRRFDRARYFKKIAYHSSRPMSVTAASETCHLPASNQVLYSHAGYSFEGSR